MLAFSAPISRLRSYALQHALAPLTFVYTGRSKPSGVEPAHETKASRANSVQHGSTRLGTGSQLFTSDFFSRAEPSGAGLSGAELARYFRLV